MRRFGHREDFAGGGHLFSTRLSTSGKDGQDLKDALVSRVFELVRGKCSAVIKAGSY